MADGLKASSCDPLTSKMWCFDGAFYVTIAEADIGSLKSLHTFLSKDDSKQIGTDATKGMVQSNWFLKS